MHFTFSFFAILVESKNAHINGSSHLHCSSKSPCFDYSLPSRITRREGDFVAFKCHVFGVTSTDVSVRPAFIKKQ